MSTSPGAPSPLSMADLDQAVRAYLQALLDLPDHDFAAPSLLPGWSRAHVVAHLANNGLALRHAIDAFQDENPIPVYASEQQRDADIEAVARRSPRQLRDVSEYACREAGGAISTIRPDQHEQSIERTPGGGRLSLGMLLPMRIREMVVHHADLDIGFGPADWPEPVALALLDLAKRDRVDAIAGHELQGAPGDITWWLLGRGSGEGVSTDNPAGLPHLGPWR